MAAHTTAAHPKRQCAPAVDKPDRMALRPAITPSHRTPRSIVTTCDEQASVARRPSINPAGLGTDPLDPALRAELLTTRARPLVVALPYARDPALVRHALSVMGRRRSPPHIERACCQALLTLWELDGPDAVRAALAVKRYHTGVVAESVRAALERRDGLAHMRAETAKGPDATEIVRSLRTTIRSSEARHIVTAAGTPVDWPAVIAAHRQESLPSHAQLGIAGAADCPPRSPSHPLEPLRHFHIPSGPPP